MQDNKPDVTNFYMRLHDDGLPHAAAVLLVDEIILHALRAAGIVVYEKGNPRFGIVPIFDGAEVEDTAQWVAVFQSLLQVISVAILH